MTVSADRLMATGPTPKELWLTVGLSILLHGLLLVLVVLVPRFQVGTYITVPVSYTVNLVSAAPGGGRAAGPAPASPSPPAAAPAPKPAPAPAPAPRPAPAPPPAPKPSEELTLPAKRPILKKAPAEVEPSLRPPAVAVPRVAPRQTVPETRPQPPAAPVAPAAPAPPATPGPPVASVAPPAATATTTPGGGGGKQGGIELAGEKGAGSGGSALGYYLGLVDYKISSNWTPLASGGGKGAVVVIRFRVLRSGTVKDVALEEGSGDAGLDTSAMRAIRQSVPLPPFPNLLTEPFLDLRYRFVMERG